MFKQFTTITLAAFLAASVVAQSGPDISFRSQFLGRQPGGRGFQPADAAPVHFLGFGFATQNGVNNGSISYAVDSSRLFWQIQGNGDFEGSGAGLSLYGETAAFTSKYVGATWIFGYDHGRPSFNDAYAGISFSPQTNEDDPVSLGLTFAFIKIWDSGFEDTGIGTDVSLGWKTPRPELSFDGGFAFESDVTGDETYFIRAAWKQLGNRYRVKYSQGGRLTFDVRIKL